MKFEKTFGLGFAAGVGGTLLLLGLVQFTSSVPSKNIVAQIEGERLARSELERLLPEEWVLLENDEYQILERSANDWLEKRLLDREAKALGISLKDLYLKQIWSQVQVTPAKVTAYYQSSRKLFSLDVPLEKVYPQIFKELRKKEYEEVKAEYLKGLKEKYKAKIYLKKPRSFAPSLALPAEPPPSFEGQAIVPLPATSETGSSPSKGPRDAGITIEEFADFHCGFCKRAVSTMEQVLKNYPDKVRLVFRHHPLSTTPGQGSYLTHEASLCAQDQGKFWDYHDALFALPGTPTESDLRAVAEQTRLDLASFEDCLKSGKHRDFLQKELEEGNRRGVDGTPTFFVNDKVVPGAYPYEHFVQLIDGILNPGKAEAAPAVAPPSPAPPSPPAPSVPVRFDDLEGKPSQGPKNAPITLVEFSDFHCPFCKRLTPTIDELQKNFSGKIRRIWRHYPLPMHPGADRTHEASQCAAEQDKFWPYHDKLFETLGGARDDAALIQIAKDLGLDQKKFESCLAGGKHKELIQKEIAKGNEVGVSGTPATFINGQLVSGAQPYENFERIIQSELAKK